jgi:hypothetical protein
MSILSRLALPGLFALTAAFAHATDPRALPVALPFVPPVVLNTVAFQYRTDGENHKAVVSFTPTMLRVDEPDDGYSIIHDPATDHYTGLEHRNYTFWEFSWPEVRASVEASKRYETHLQDLGNEGLNSDYAQTAVTNDAASAGTSSISADGDGSGYVWQPTKDHKRIAGIDCVRWTGDTVGGENVIAWCTGESEPQVRAAMEHLRTINEPIALVPVRTIVPPFVFLVYDGLVKGGVVPLQIEWGSDQDKNSFAFVSEKTLRPDASAFTIPKLYNRTTLITMDGMLDQKN